MKKLGMIGGTSWHSTIDYYRYINQLANDRLGKKANPELLMYSINIEVMYSGDWERIERTFVESAKTLERAGADALIFCANTPHKLYPQVAAAISIPILHIADAIGEEARRLGLHNLGLLGTLPTMTEGFIAGRLYEKHRIECVLPANEAIEPIHEIITSELVQGTFTTESRQKIIVEMDRLKAQGADGIILGCTELPMLLKDIRYPLPMLNTTRLHAQMCVNFILAD